jgi:hypothetical protein
VTPSVAIEPSALFRCERGGGNGPPCTMLRARCLERQGKRWERKGATRSKRWVARGATFPFCASGDCDQGRALAGEMGAAAPTLKRVKDFGSVASLIARPRPVSGPVAVGLSADQVAAAAARVREAMRHPSRVATPPPSNHPAPLAPANDDPPAQPAQETTMPTGTRSTPCPGCGTKGSKHCQVDGKDCPERAKGKRAAPSPAKKTPGPKSAPAPRAKAAKAPQEAYVVPVGQLSDDDLARSVAQARAEIQRRKLEARTRFEKLEELEKSIGEAA